jgi:hypothetical protein
MPAARRKINNCLTCVEFLRSALEQRPRARVERHTGSWDRRCRHDLLHAAAGIYRDSERSSATHRMTEQTELLPSEVVRQRERIAGNLDERVFPLNVDRAAEDGVICQTAIETAMEDMRIQYILHKRVPLEGPLVETPTHWITIGFGDSLDLALVDCIVRMLRWSNRASGIDQRDLYALYSVAASYRVTQYSNQTGTVYAAVPPKAVHGMLPKELFTSAMRARISESMRPGA